MGAEIRVNAPVAQVIVKSNQADRRGPGKRGRALRRRGRFQPRPQADFPQSGRPQELPADLVQDSIRNFNIRGSSGKVNLALDALPDLTCMPGNGRHLAGAISISPSVDYMETGL